MYGDNEQTKAAIIAQPLVTNFFPILPFFALGPQEDEKQEPTLKSFANFFSDEEEKKCMEKKRMNE